MLTTKFFELFKYMEIHKTSFIILLLIFIFAVIHSGGAALRVKAETVIGARAWRLIFAFASIPSALILIGYFISHRYDGIRFWNFQGVSELIPVIWILIPVRKKTGTGKTTSNQQAVGGLHHRRDQITDSSIRGSND